MLRLWILAVILCAYARDAYGRNETVHACELVLKCFQDADNELLQCQSILSVDAQFQNGISGDANAANETTAVEPTTAAAASADDCMAPIKQKMQQKRALVEQRAQAFALCLNERMDRGPEDVDPRKFRYCNTVISRYNARTTIATSPEFTVVTTPAVGVESTTTSTTRHRTTGGSPHTATGTTAKKSSTQSASTIRASSATASITTRRPSSPTAANNRSTASTFRAPLGSVRPRRQAPNSNLELEAAPGDVFAAAVASNGSNGDIIRPATASPPAKRPEATTPIAEAVPLATKNGGSTDPFDLITPSAPVGQQVLPENEAGRIGAVARFSSSGQSSTANKEPERAGEKALPKNNATVQRQSTPLPLDQNLNEAASPQPLGFSPEIDINQNKTLVTGLPQSEQRASPEGLISPLPPVASSILPNFPNGASPPAAGPPASNPLGQPNLGESGPPGTRLPFDSAIGQTQGTPLPESNFTLLPARPPGAGNDTLGASPVLVQQQEQLEVGVVQTAPLDQPLDVAPPLDFNPAVSPPSGPSPPGIASSTPTLATTTTTTSSPVAIGIANTIGSATADEKQRNRVETLRESRRRVSEFKACMARARIKREECKPMVNCCPDSVKCHLRYELSELHDQIHRLELEISEGRQACLEKKKTDDRLVDALDQIDEEDLISDESIVSQQVF